MSLATRCTSCGTVFRVVQDQLKVSEGWVRCGRCESVFNALDSIFDMERETPRPWSAESRDGLDSRHGSEPVPPFPPVPPVPEPFVNSTTEVTLSGASASRLRASPFADAPEGAAERAGPGGADAATLGQFGSTPPPGLRAPSSDERPRRISGPPSAGAFSQFSDEASAGAVPGLTPVDPEFVRRANAAARWRSPGMRLALSLLVAMLTLALALQAARHWRDTLAARWPAASPLVQALCANTGCQIEPLRHLDALVVDSSGLTRLDAVNLYRLSLVMRNRDVVPVMPPAIDLTLTDSQGEVVARKVLRAADLGLNLPAIAGGGEHTLKALLDAGERRIVGYDIALFYP